MIAASMKRSLWPALLLLLMIPAVWPVLTVPFLHADDIVIHLFRVAGLDDALRNGILYPRWFPDFAFGYGHAVFTYYSPLSYYIAEIIHVIGADFVNAQKIAFALGYVGSGFALYLFARRFVAPAASLAGAAAYTYFPYHLVETYKRGALAEHIAWIFPPLIFWAATPWNHETARQTTRRTVIFIASAAALILTHNLSALIVLPFAFLYYWLMQGGIPLIRRFVLVVLSALGVLGLSAFYWLPIVAQTRWVQLSVASEGGGFARYSAPALRFVQDAFFFDYARPEGYPDHPLGFLSFLVVLASLVVGVIGLRRRDPLAGQIFFFVALSLLAAFMTTDLSLPVWYAFSVPLAFLQFPWRFMTLTGFGIAMTAALALGRWPRFALSLIPLLLVTALVGLNVRSAAVPATDFQSMGRLEFRGGGIGTTWTEEFVPWWVQADKSEIPRSNGEPPAGLTLQAPQLTLLEAGYTLRRYRVQAAESFTLRAHQFYFPTWHASLDGRPLSPYPSTNLGLLSVDVPPTTGGILELELDMSPAELAGAYLSALTAVVLAWLARGRWLAGLALLALLGGFFMLTNARGAPIIQAVNAQVEDLAELVAARTDKTNYRPGESIRVTLTWLDRRETSENLIAFIHVTEMESGRRVIQSDAVPVGGYTTLSQWRLGEVIEDSRILLIPADTQPGTLQLTAGLYRLQPLKNLSATQNGLALPDGRISIGTVQVSKR